MRTAQIVRVENIDGYFRLCLSNGYIYSRLSAKTIKILEDEKNLNGFVNQMVLIRDDGRVGFAPSGMGKPNISTAQTIAMLKELLEFYEA